MSDKKEGFSPDVVSAFLIGLAATLREFDLKPPPLISTTAFDARLVQILIEQWQDNPVLPQSDFERVLGLREILRRALEDEKMKEIDPPRGYDH